MVKKIITGTQLRMNEDFKPIYRKHFVMYCNDIYIYTELVKNLQNKTEKYEAASYMTYNVLMDEFGETHFYTLAIW